MQKKELHQNISFWYSSPHKNNIDTCFAKTATIFLTYSNNSVSLLNKKRKISLIINIMVVQIALFFLLFQNTVAIALTHSPVTQLIPASQSESSESVIS